MVKCGLTVFFYENGERCGRLNFLFAGLTVWTVISGLFGLSATFLRRRSWPMKEHDFTEVVSLIVKEDLRFAKNGYVFLQKALNYTIDKERKRQGKVVTKTNKRHVSGQELLDGIREYTLEQYGPMSYFMLKSWGIRQ